MGFIGAMANVAIAGVGANMSRQASLDEGHLKGALDYLNMTGAEVGAQDALQRGSMAAAQLRMRGNQLAGQQKAAYAASGVDSSSGSAADTLASTRAMAELDAQTAKNNAAREALGYKQRAFQYGLQGVLDEKRTENEISTSQIKAVSSGVQSILGSAGGSGGSFLGGD